MDILQKMQLQEQEYSKSETKVYQFLKDNFDKLETLTITKIASSSGTSTSAVLRFCQILGYKGFKDFRYDAINYIHQKPKEETEDILDQIADNYHVILNQMKHLKRQEIDELVDCILKKERLHILGIFLSSLPAKYLHFGLQDLGIASHLASDLNSGNHLTNIIEEKDTLVMFSVSGSASNFNNTLSAISQNMPQNSYLITLNEHAAAAKYFNHVIILPGNSLSKQSIVDTQTIAMVFVEILLNMIHRKL